MDLMVLFKKIIDVFVRIMNMSTVIGGYRLTFASIIVFAVLTALVLWFLKGLAE